MRVTTDTRAIALLQGFRRSKVITVDTETIGEKHPVIGSDGEEVDVDFSALIPHRAHLVSIQICSLNGPRYTFLVGYNGNLKLSALLPALKELLEDPKVLKVYHNANYDISVFANYGIQCKNTYCTMIAGACQDENMEKGLKARAVLVGMLLKKTKTINFDDADDLVSYGEDDITATERLYQFYEGTPAKRGLRMAGKIVLSSPAMPPKLEGMRREFYEKQEAPYLNLIIGAEQRGMLVDLKRIAAIDEQITDECADHVKEIYKHAGGPFKIGSVKQLGSVLYDKLGLVAPEDCVTPAGTPQTNARTLFYLKGQHPIVEELLEYKSKHKLQEVYTSPVSGLPHYCDARGYVHASCNTVGAHTFRSAYSQPNLTTIPSKKDRYGLRYCFIAPDGYTVCVFDYSQIEVRMQANYSRDPIMVDELNKPKGDIYVRTATEFGSNDPAKERQMFKVIVLALQYGMGPWTLADQMTMAGYIMSKREAAAMIATYFRIYDGIPRLWDAMFTEHVQNGYFETLFGRPRQIPNFVKSYSYGGKRTGLNETERALVNNAMQGATADFVKQSMLRIWRDRKVWSSGYRMNLQVHDEVIGVAPTAVAQEIMEHITKIAILSPPAPFHPRRELVVKTKLEYGCGSSWKAAKP